METMDVTPRWEEATKLFRFVLENTRKSVRQTHDDIWEEITNMARLADAYVAEHPELRKES